MQISKTFLIAGVAVVALSQPTARAADTEAQSQAREAMRKAMEGMQPQPAVVVTQAPAPKVVQPRVTPAPQTATPSPAPTQVQAPRRTGSVPAAIVQPQSTTTPPRRNAAATLVLPPSAPPDAIARAREAVRQTMNTLPAEEPVQAAAPEAPAATPPVTPAAPAPEKPVAPAVVAPAPAVADSRFAPLPAAAPSQDVDKAREALHAKMNQLTAEVAAPAVAPAAAPVQPTPGAPAKPAAPRPPEQKFTVSLKKPPVFETIQGPPSPLSQEKQQRLDALLAKYKADQITPEQYHAERAKIMAEP